MAYLGALWSALMAFFSHLQGKKKIEEATRQQARAEQTAEAAQQAVQDAQTREAERHKHDEAVRGAAQSDRDKRLDRWMRD